MLAYPILLDVTTVRTVIVGGGGVGRRKAAGLIDAGATKVTVVSPTPLDGFPTPVRHVAATYTPRVLADARLVFAATNDPAVNAAVVVDARAIGALACRADAGEDGPGDFVTPALLRDGPITITVSAGSAALTSAIRDGLRGRLDPRWAKMADAMATLRPLLRDRLPAAARPAAFRKLATDEAFDVLESDGAVGLLAWLEANRRPTS